MESTLSHIMYQLSIAWKGHTHVHTHTHPHTHTHTHTHNQEANQTMVSNILSTIILHTVAAQVLP